MAKKHVGRFLTFAAIAGAVAAGVSYFLQYKSFHKELDEDFHDFEDDFDDFDDTDDKDSSVTRNYVSLTPEKKNPETAPEGAGAKHGADTEGHPEAKEGTEAKEDTAAQAEETSEGEPESASEGIAEPAKPEDDDRKEALQPDTTVTVEEATEE